MSNYVNVFRQVVARPEILAGEEHSLVCQSAELFDQLNAGSTDKRVESINDIKLRVHFLLIINVVCADDSVHSKSFCLEMCYSHKLRYSYSLHVH